VANKDKSLLQSLLEGGVAAGGGALDESAFGLLEDRYPEYVKEQMNEYPVASGAGRFASYFNPLAIDTLIAGKVGGAAVKNSGKLMKLLEKTGLSPKTIAGMIEGGVSGGTAAGVNSGIRQASGQAGADTASDAATGTVLGAIIGGPANLLKSKAKEIYTHPSFVSGNDKADEAVINMLRNEGFVGTKKGAQDLAERKMSSYKDAEAEITGGARRRESSATKGKGGIPVRMKLNYPPGAVSPGQRNAYDEAIRMMGNDLAGPYGTKTSIGKVESKLKDINTALVPHRNAYNPDVATTSQVETLQGLKENLQELKSKGIDLFGKEGDAGELEQLAKSTYRPAKNLDTNIRSYDRGERVSSSGVKTPRSTNILSQLIGGTADYTVNSAPVRTFVGSQLEKTTPAYLGAVAGKTGEVNSRTNRSSKERMLAEKYSKLYD
jgi:hypothetical protein